MAGAGWGACHYLGWPAAEALLPAGAAPPALETPHFASRMQAFVWRNWQLVSVDRMAATVGARESDMVELGRSLGLGEPPPISSEIERRAFITVIRRNWHLLPYEQLLTLLGWTAEQLAFTLREDDFLYVKLGSLKPRCAPLKWSPPTPAERARAAEIAALVREEFGEVPLTGRDPLFGFVSRLSAAPPRKVPPREPDRGRPEIPRFCYSYFALYGDALLDPALDPYPEGYLARLAEAGVNGVWLQGLLANLAPFPWDERISAGYEQRREQLRRLVERAGRFGIKVYVYLNEPRSRPLAFFERHPGLKGVAQGDHAALCTSAPEVRGWLIGAVESLCRAVPDLGGFFTITASENFTNCWSHHQGGSCPRCGERGAAEVIADLLRSFQEGIQRAGGRQTLIAWDWGWAEAWAEEAVRRLPDGIAVMSVSEWDVTIERGGVRSQVGEYSLSALGPGPRARRHWAAARRRGLPAFAKLQVGTTWELASVPFIPAVEQAWAQGHNLREEKVSGLMLGWTLGGHPSPNLEATVAGLNGEDLEAVAVRRHGARHAGPALAAWRGFSRAFREFPFHIGSVYHAPWQMGPANPLWNQPTGYASTMVGLPYDDVTRWRSIYPVETWCTQLERVADGFETTAAELAAAVDRDPPPGLEDELRFAQACAIHWRSAATQARWITQRDAPNPDPATGRALLLAELSLARRLHRLQSQDSRIGFEASNHYFYVPLDLVEKVINCRWLLREG
ncbi:MAG: hypothetical protein KJ072_03155 [Verrucomicrobia bacterium]|nr:hypothetical protein [Verrucomicrobiota bacterium]